MMSIEELVSLRQILGECLKLAYTEQTINRLLESERVVVREIKLKTTNYVTGKPFANSLCDYGGDDR